MILGVLALGWILTLAYYIDIKHIDISKYALPVPCGLLIPLFFIVAALTGKIREKRVTNPKCEDPRKARVVSEIKEAESDLERFINLRYGLTLEQTTQAAAAPEKRVS
ncbi:MAG: hypothetical protein HYY24_28720 [Verrucomicrobia bacterium]|nr:hypothetical protein [Verrucomicrobiota bacterium]